MKNEWQQTIREMRLEGYAVVVFTPEEIGDASASFAEDIMIERGWQYIESDQGE